LEEITILSQHSSEFKINRQWCKVKLIFIAGELMWIMLLVSVIYLRF